jgi:hypothetical protein
MISLRIKFIIIIPILFYSCIETRKVDSSRGTAEGIITYSITYPPEVSSHQMSFMFPKEMTLYFRNDLQRLSFKGGMSLYNFDFIFNGSNDTIFTLLRVNLLDKKLYVPTSNRELFIFSEMQSDDVVFVPDEQREIIGFAAQKAIVKLNLTNVSDIVTWYTTELGIKSLNRNTPFRQIPGVLLESEIIYKNIQFRFKAQKIDTTGITSDLFIVPDDYELTSIAEIEELLNTVL